MLVYKVWTLNKVLYILITEEGSIRKMSKRRTFTDEFKTMIAELVLSGQSAKDVASEYSLSETAVRNWAKKKTPINVAEGDSTNLEEINRIRKENARLKEENEILKKAMAIFIKK